MGDISEMRGLIVVGSFIGCLVLLMSLIPSQLIVASYEGRTIEPPTYFDSVDMLCYVDTENITLDDSGSFMEYEQYYYYNFEIAGVHFRLIDSALTDLLEVQHYRYWWIFPTNFHKMEWLDKNGISQGKSLDDDELNSDYQEGNIRYSLKCEHKYITAFFGFNETIYSDPKSAWENNDLHILFGITFDQANTGTNAWNIISQILFFQLPDIQPIVNALIAIPFWIAVAYVAIILLYRTLGAVFGGGA